jgi:hypothetical protein
MKSYVLLLIEGESCNGTEGFFWNKNHFSTISPWRKGVYWIFFFVLFVFPSDSVVDSISPNRYSETTQRYYVTLRQIITFTFTFKMDALGYPPRLYRLSGNFRSHRHCSIMTALYGKAIPWRIHIHSRDVTERKGGLPLPTGTFKFA